MPISTARRFGIAALVFASVLWGTTGTAASFLPDSVSPIAIGASTMVVGGLLLFVFSARASLAAIRRPEARKWLLLGVIGVVIYPLAFYSAMDQAGVAIGNVVALGSGPVFAALFEWLWERHRLSARWVVSTTIAIAGIILLSSARPSTEGKSVVLGIGLGLLAGLSYALFTYASGRAMRTGISGRAAMGGMFGMGAVVLLPVLLVTGAPLLQSLQTASIAAYLAVGPMFVAYLLFGFGLRGIRSSVVTTVTLIEPVVATLLAVLIVGEQLSWTGWLGLALILIGVGVLVSARHPENLPEQS